MTVHRKAVLIAAALATSAALALTGCSAGGGDSADSPDGTQLLTIPREDMGTFARNFNPFSNPEFPMTQQAIYESMLIYNPATAPRPRGWRPSGRWPPTARASPSPCATA